MFLSFSFLYLLLDGRRALNFISIDFFYSNICICLKFTFCLWIQRGRACFDFWDKLFICGICLVGSRWKRPHTKSKWKLLPLKSNFNEFSAFLINYLPCFMLYINNIIANSPQTLRWKLYNITFNHPVFLHLAKILKQFCRGKRCLKLLVIMDAFSVPETASKITVSLWK